MSSPAERYAAARRRGPPIPLLSDFTADLGFTLDPFQVEACEALEEGSGVLVCAPTGAGKTVVGEFAVHKALAEGRKAFYTTPIKALSNQKYADLVERYGPDKVGLLTGDNAVNGDAPVVVMTTEVLRNMLYADSPALRGLGYVVMDEVHYLADRFRGAVWEEVIIHLPHVGHAGVAVGDGEQRRGVRRLAGHRARGHRRWWSARSGRSRCGSTCWSATGSSTCSRCARRRTPRERPTPRASCPPGSAAPPSSTPSWSATSRSTSAGSTPGTAAAAAARRDRYDHRPRYRPPARSDVVEPGWTAPGLLPAITFVFSRNGLRRRGRASACARACG